MWTPVTKPSTSEWINTNPQGRIQYDEIDVLYDDAEVRYDGNNIMEEYTFLTKPTNSVWTMRTKPV